MVAECVKCCWWHGIDGMDADQRINIQGIGGSVDLGASWSWWPLNLGALGRQRLPTWAAKQLFKARIGDFCISDRRLAGQIRMADRVKGLISGGVNPADEERSD